MIILYLVLGVLLLSFIPVAVLATRTFLRHRGTRMVRCPETGHSAAIELDPGHAAFTAATGETELRVRKCGLWPGHEGCGRECTAQVETA